MAAVLAIHATQSASERLAHDHQWASEDGLATLLNQLSRFCVPMFVLLSGFALAARERAKAEQLKLDHPRVAAMSFYGDRLAKIALPFIVWSLLYRLCDAPWSNGAANAIDWSVSRLPFDLVSGSAQYHLYFVAIILQCYVLFPLLVRLRSLWWLVAMFGVGLFFTSPAHELCAKLGFTRPELPSYAVPVWLCWFHLGVRAGLSGTTVEYRPFVRSVALYAVSLTAALVCGEWWWRSWQMSDPGWFGHFHRWVVIAYVAACWWFLVSWNTAIAAWFSAPQRVATLNWLVGISFAVYLAHPLILRAVNAWGWPQHALIQVALLTLASLIAVALVSWLLKPLPKVARALGL